MQIAYLATLLWQASLLDLGLVDAAVAGSTDSASTAAETSGSDDSYQLGQGLPLLDSNWRLGGYAAASYDNLKSEPARADLDHLSAFLWWDSQQRWKFFSELDYENVVASRPGQREDEDRYLALERLYVDYAVTDTSTVRAGKFLTPIGRWNEIHAAPLVWTTSRPLITDASFPANVTGLMLRGQVPGTHGVEYSLYGSNGREWRANPDQDPFYEAVGARLRVPIGIDANIGFSYANFEQKHASEEKKQLLGADFVWNWRRWEFSGEGIYRSSENGKSWDERGAYLQLAAPLTQTLYAVGRFETFLRAQENTTTQLWVTGLNWRALPALVVKAEWIGGRHNRIDAQEGFLSSISVLF